jgi:hypothetical protein
MSDKVLKSFQFHMPVDLVKAEDEDGDWRIRGIASTPDVDLQGENVDQSGLDISLLKAGRGIFNYDHQKGPENILGAIEDANFKTQDGKTVLEVDGYLFKHQDRSKAFFNILKSIKKSAGPRVHLSIEGKILQRDAMNKSTIRKARVEKVALTLDPVNPYTYVDLEKSMNDPNLQPDIDPAQESITINKAELSALIQDAVVKAMSAGADSSAPSQKTGGSTLMKESLERKVKKINKADKKSQKAMLKSICEQVIELFPEEDPKDLVKAVLDTFTKFKETEDGK